MEWPIRSSSLQSHFTRTLVCSGGPGKNQCTWRASGNGVKLSDAPSHGKADSKRRHGIVTVRHTLTSLKPRNGNLFLKTWRFRIAQSQHITQRQQTGATPPTGPNQKLPAPQCPAAVCAPANRAVCLRGTIQKSRPGLRRWEGIQTREKKLPLQSEMQTAVQKKNITHKDYFLFVLPYLISCKIPK